MSWIATCPHETVDLTASELQSLGILEQTKLYRGVMFDCDLEIIEKRIEKIKPLGIFAGNMGIIGMCLDLPIILDYNSNCFIDFYKLLFFQPYNLINTIW